MHYVVRQLLPAAPGMYAIDNENRTATLVVMWALVQDTNDNVQILPLTNVDLAMDLMSVITARFDDDITTFSSKAIDGYQTIR